jgi:predicted AAA+ superfamily ATPase
MESVMMIFKRQVIDEVTRYLPTGDIIVLHGARQVGKTSILMYLQNLLQNQGNTTHYIDLEDSRYLAILNRGVDTFTNYLKEEGFDLETLNRTSQRLYVLIDEIQYLANPSPFLKLISDHHPYLKLVVSGSSSFGMKSKFTDSLVGRTVNFEIYPLSFQEMLLFRGITYVPGLPLSPKKTEELRQAYIEFALYGGYPKIVLTPGIEMKEKYLQQIIDTYIRKDIRDLAEIRDINRFNYLLEILSSQSENLLNIAELANTCSLARATVERFLFLLEQTYVIRMVHPFSRNLRTELFKTPKVFFLDSGLMQMVWLKQLQKELLGSVFETTIFTELVKRYGVQNVYFWRTTGQKEVDFVVRDAVRSTLLPVEAKLHFPRAVPTGLHAFLAAYPPAAEQPGQDAYKITGITGEPGEKMVFPWQL